MIISKESDIEGTYQLAEKLRKTIESDSAKNSHAITASFGVGEPMQESLPEFLKRVDNALYRAKEKGRNRTERG